MKKRRRDPIREDRIENEAIVDAASEEQAMGWYHYLESKIRFPFTAKCIATDVVSPLRTGETVEVIRKALENNYEHDMFVQQIARLESGSSAEYRERLRMGAEHLRTENRQ